MLKKKLGIEAIERNWEWKYNLASYFKIFSSTFIIPEGCKRIGRSAFWGCERLREVIILEGCKWIGHHAFYKCEGLKEVIISESVMKIEDWAFGCCHKAVVILQKPKNRLVVGTCALIDCKDVEEKIRI